MTRVAPGRTIGILGGGQLGRMLASAASQLGFDVHIYCPEDDAPAARVATKHWHHAYEDSAALTAFVEACDVVTLEFENIPVATAHAITAGGTSLYPPAKALGISQDRAEEKAFFEQIGLATAPYALINSVGDIAPALDKLGGTGILKTRREGYDGKGQVRLGCDVAPDTAWQAIGGVPALLEGLVPFACEISVIAARSSTGETCSWAPPRNIHEDGILARSVVPSGLADDVEQAARAGAERLITALDYVGVLALEYFVLEDGRLIANEFAPRVHNSGHWTPEACQTGQFEQHIRAICGWPLGNTRRLFDAEMANLIGKAGEIDPSALTPNDKLTLYGKREVREGRKMGHITRRLQPRKD